MRRIAIGLPLLLLFLGLPLAAEAQITATVFKSLSQADCPAEKRLSPERARAKVMARAGVAVDEVMLRTMAEGRLGSEAATAYGNCRNLKCKDPDKQALARLWDDVFDLDGDFVAPAHFTLKTSAPADWDNHRRAMDFLNGRFGWLSIECTPEQEKADSGEEGDSWFSHVVIGKTEDDAGKTSISKRDFASFGYSEDHQTDKRAYDIDLYVAYAFRKEDRTGWEVFAAMNRHSEGADTVSFGAAWSRETKQYVVRLKGAWQTDHRFESNVWRADFTYRPRFAFFRSGDCSFPTADGSAYALCSLDLTIDYMDVGDPGDNADLAKLTSAARIGGAFHVEAGHAFTVGDRETDKGWLFVSFDYATRSDISGRGGNADRITASLGFKPGDDSRYKVSLDYTKGQDLYDLSEEDKIALVFGYRQ